MKDFLKKTSKIPLKKCSKIQKKDIGTYIMHT